MTNDTKTNENFQILELDQRAHNYLKSIIEQYSLLIQGNEKYPQLFMEQILQKVDLIKGKVITCLPEGTKSDSIYEFEHAKKNVNEVGELLHRGYIVPVESTRGWLIQIFKQYLDSENKDLIFKNIYSRPTDPYFATRKEKTLTTEHEVFYFLTSKEGTLDNIEALVQLSDGAHPPLFAVCSVLPDSLHKGGVLSSEDIIFIVNNINCIVISAYDGDSYLVWERKSEK
jgi:hypothetical protein